MDLLTFLATKTNKQTNEERGKGIFKMTVKEKFSKFVLSCHLSDQMTPTNTPKR